MRSFTTRLTVALALLLLAYGAFVALLGRQVAGERAQESMQRLSYGLARHIVEHWPQIAVVEPAQADRVARGELLSMLMVVNPGIQVYVLDAQGRVQDYIGDASMVRQPQVELAALRDFLDGAPLPLRGTDPMGSGVTRIFSAAMFAQRAGDTGPPGYLYIVLDGLVQEQVAGQLSLQRVWLGAGVAAAIGLLATMLAGAMTFRRLSQPLRRLARRMREYGARDVKGLSIGVAPATSGDELRDIGTAFDDMTRRVEQQTATEQHQAAAHREVMASVAHDLRTPLTALHGHLEALGDESLSQSGQRERLLVAALGQSDKVRRLSQQLFELAALQATDEVLHRERFRLDELVTDAVQKFALTQQPPRVLLDGTPPDRLELEGDLQLVERALSNLIDNALRHAPGTTPVRISLQRDGAMARVVVEDGGPGLPSELLLRLDRQQSVRDPPLKRTSGGIGGLGLAIAQRVAMLHGGSLRPLPAPQGGTRLCLALPLAA
ncbi:MAG: HAMP domain-containing sensor histidine kinase [Rubrivivax sp.]